MTRAEIEAYLPRLLDEDEQAAYDAADELADMPGPVLECAERWAADKRPRLREMACRILSQLAEAALGGDKPPGEYVAGLGTLDRILAGDRDEAVREAAVAAIARYGPKVALPRFEAAAADPSSEVRVCAAMSAGSARFGGPLDPCGDDLKPAYCALLLRLMDDEDDDARNWAAFGLHQGGHDTPGVRARLLRALDDPYEEVRGEAARGLAEFGDRDLPGKLLRMLLDDPEPTDYLFEAAGTLRMPALLPAVLAAAARCESDDAGRWAVERLTEALRQQNRMRALHHARRSRRARRRGSH